MNDDLMRIGELARRTHKTVRALHVYEERGLIEPAARSRGGFRLYDQANAQRIHLIDDLKALGCTLEEIGTLLRAWTDGDTPSAAAHSVAQAYRTRLGQVNDRIAALQALAAQLERAVGFLEGCQPCARDGEPTAACCECDRAQVAGDDLVLLSGLMGG